MPEGCAGRAAGAAPPAQKGPKAMPVTAIG